MQLADGADTLNLVSGSTVNASSGTARSATPLAALNNLSSGDATINSGASGGDRLSSGDATINGAGGTFRS